MDGLVNNTVSEPRCLHHAPDDDKLTRSNTWRRPSYAARPSRGCSRRAPHREHLLERGLRRRARPRRRLRIEGSVSHFIAHCGPPPRLPVGITHFELVPIPTDAGQTGYYQLTASSSGALPTRIMVDFPRFKVADEVVSAVQKGRRHVRLPKRAVLAPLLSEAPRRSMELLLTGVPHQAK